MSIKIARFVNLFSAQKIILYSWHKCNTSYKSFYDATTFSIMTLSIMKLSIMKLSIVTLSIMTLSIMSLNRKAHDIMTLT